MRILEEIKREVREKMANDPAHDFSHIMRVYKIAGELSEKEGANKKLTLAAALLHDIIVFPKNRTDSGLSALRSAEEAQKILSRHNFSARETGIVIEAIRDHSYSRNRVPTTIEGLVLQDADRLDALGAIGIARVFAVGSAAKIPFYHNEDPFCYHREPDDKKWIIDHFFKKILKLKEKINTKSARQEAERRSLIIENYLRELKKEI